MGKLGLGNAAIAGLCALLISACGGGGGFTDGSGSSSGGTSSGGTSSGGSSSTPVYKIGVLNGSTFTPGAIAVGTSPLDAGGSSGLRVDIVDTANGNTLVTLPVSVIFSSPCAASGQASIASPVTTGTGTATSTYQARGCSGSETITATATVDSVSLVASATIIVKPAPVSSIQFSSANPNSIRIKGTGDPQTAVVKFTVTNSAGGPVSGQSVKFALDTTAGGITLSPAAGTTDSLGTVQTTVSAGTVATSVRVTATVLDDTGAVVNTVPPAQSDSLVISTGLADQNSFSISAGCFNIEGGDYDGTTTNINILASDRFNNPVPDGTAIAFRAEGGQIQSQCLTSGGGCNVDFKSSEPRTADHRVTVLATAIGEESFTDGNGNGQYDNGEAFTDLAEAFVDKNENFSRDADEEFVDFNNSGSFNAASGNFTGVLCKTGCDTATSVSVRASLPIIMSGSEANLLVSPSTVDISDGPVVVRVTVGDSANQPMPAQSTISATTSFGSLVGDSSYVQACSAFNGPFVYSFVVQPPENQTTSKSGVMTIKVTTPKGVITVASVPVIYTVATTGGGTPVPPGNLQSINFVSASPTTISIKGTGVGQPETSTVVFRVLDDKGNPLSGQVVNFSLNTTVGGISMDQTSVTTGSDGLATVRVNAGTIHTSVRVTAEASSVSTNVQAVSDSLVISTAIPDRDSVSLSTSQFNIEGENFDGEQATLTVRLADRFNNPVPDGTAVSFSTEGGSIQPQCVTAAGACSVLFTSQNPRVADHRYTILATVIGEESFTDLNGNGVFDAGEPFSDSGEAFLDRNENGVRDAGSEPFLDFNSNGSFDGPSGNFTGVLCSTGCDTAKTLHLSASLVLVMSSSEPDITISPSPISLAPGETRDVLINVRDTAGGNSIAKDSVISVVTTYGAVVSDSSLIQADSNASAGGTTYRVTLQGDALAGTGRLNVKVTTPNGVVSTATADIN